MRRAASYFAAGLALVIGAQTASANFVVTANKVAGTGSLAGYDIYRMSVTNNGLNGTGNDVQGLDLTVTADPGNVIPSGFQQFWWWKASATIVSPTGGKIFDAAEGNAAFDGLNYDFFANKTGFVAGDSFGDTVNRGQGTYLGLTGVSSTPAGAGSSGGQLGYAPNNTAWKVGTQTPSGTANLTYSTTKTFRTAAGYSFTDAGFANDRLTGTVRFGNIIVPTGNIFTIAGTFGSVAAGSGSDPKFAVNFTNAAVPEPASLGLVGLGMLVLGRRRRQA